MKKHAGDGTVQVRRDSLLERLERSRPAIVAMVAPAGFGKSTLARQFLAGQSVTAICDVEGILDGLDLARRLLPALAIERPELTQALTQRELMLGDDGTSSAGRVNLALEAWRAGIDGTSSTFVFENAEHIARSGDARDLLARLLAARPDGRSIVICSREHLRLHLTRFAAPHQIMTLRAGDLAFDRDEIRRIFAPQVSDEATIARIMQLSQGWPIAVFLLKRFANEGLIEKLLEKLDDVAFEELHDYLADQILASLDPALVEALFACAAIPEATSSDLRLVLPNESTMRALLEFSRESPFLTRTPDGVYSVHPLLGTLLLEQRQERRAELLTRLAESFATVGDFQRAAELHLARGNSEAAANALGQHEVLNDRAPSMAYARALSSLDRKLVQSYPRLWSVTALLRIFCIDMEELLDEAEAVWRTISPDATPMERYHVLLFRTIAMGYIGLGEEALEMVDAFAAEHRVGEEPTNRFEAHALYLQGLSRVRIGRVAEGEEMLTRVLHYMQGAEVFVASALLALGSDVARVRGEEAVAIQLHERALSHARDSGLMNFVAFALSELAVTAWFFGDDEAFVRAVTELDEIVRQHGVRAMQFLAAAGVGREAQPSDSDVLRHVVAGRLIAASKAVDAAVALREARAALSAAEQYRAPFFECIANVAVALFDEVHFDEALAHAQAACDRSDSQALQESVRALAQRRADVGMLGAFVRRMQRERVEHVPVLEICIANGTVRSQGRDVTLSERELALLTALALRRETVSRSKLADMLWPELDDYAARNSLSVCLHRLRQHLGNDRAILRLGEGYRLHDDVRVDLWEFDRLVTGARTRPALGEAERAKLEAVHESLRAQRPVRAHNWDWFEPTERHLGELRVEVAHRLATDALSHGNLPRALDLAAEMIAYDPCDEAAREVAITAHLRAGDRAAAMRQYRQYRETLQAELQCEPSESIKKLVGLSGKTA